MFKLATWLRFYNDVKTLVGMRKPQMTTRREWWGQLVRSNCALGYVSVCVGYSACAGQPS
jgi:hypothetical protein